MGLLAYKAHCSTIEPEYSFACATEGEMKEFINKAEVHLKVDKRNGQNNLVLYFTPFPVKYVNYIKRWNTKKRGPSISSRYKGDQYYMVYVQLFRIMKKQRGTNSPIWGSNYITCPWNGDNAKDEYSQEHLSLDHKVHEVTSYMNNSCGSKWKHKKVFFKYPLTPGCARRGYMILLQNVQFKNTTTRDTVLSYGFNTNQSLKGEHNFKYGIVGGLRINAHITYSPTSESISKIVNEDILS